MRILVPGGSWPMETFIERLLTGLAAHGTEITIQSKHRPSTAWLLDHGISWEHGSGSMDREGLHAQVQNNGYADAARSALAEVRHRVGARPKRTTWPDLVYAPWLNTLMADPHLFDLGVPVVTSCRGALVTIAPWDLDRPSYRTELLRVFDRSALVHCVSSGIADEAVSLGLDRAKVRVIYPAVSPTTFRPPAHVAPRGGPVRVAAVGSLIWRKDYEHALAALRRAVDAGGDLTLDIIGDGPDLQHLRYTVDDLDLGSRVRFRGRLRSEAVASVLQDTDVFLHTSSAEGVSNAVLEAMAAGLPVVTTDAGGMREAVRDGVDGFVVPVRGVAEMARALIALADGSKLRDRLGASARRRVKSDFQLDGQISRFAQLLAEATDGRRGP